MLQCVAVWCSWVAVCRSKASQARCVRMSVLLQRVAAYCSVLQCVAMCCSVQIESKSYAFCENVCIVAACCSVLQCVAVCCSVLQCVEVWCSCVAV